MRKIIELDGNVIGNEDEFHSEISRILGFTDYYGRNMDALWDCISGYIDTDFQLVWKNHQQCKNALGQKFDIVIDCLRNFATITVSLILP